MAVQRTLIPLSIVKGMGVLRVRTRGAFGSTFLHKGNISVLYDKLGRCPQLNLTGLSCPHPGAEVLLRGDGGFVDQNSQETSETEGGGGIGSWLDRGVDGRPPGLSLSALTAMEGSGGPGVQDGGALCHSYCTTAGCQGDGSCDCHVTCISY